MIFNETELQGAFILDLERREDERGFFARAFCQHEFEEHGLKPVIAQANRRLQPPQGHARGACTSRSRRRRRPSSCGAPAGAILDIIVDLRPESPTYLQHIAVELTEDNHRALYVPERFAHGYQVLADATETSYQVGEFYSPPQRAGAALRRPAPRARVAAAGDRDLREGSGTPRLLDTLGGAAARGDDAHGASISVARRGR